MVSVIVRVSVSLRVPPPLVPGLSGAAQTWDNARLVLESQ
jgi:hypothetical protein